MKSYKVNSRAMTSTRRTAIRKRVKKTHCRAKWVGFLYLLGVIAIAALAIVPLNLMTSDIIKLNVMEFWTVFTEESTLQAMVAAGLFGMMILALVINVFKALSKLNWLFTRKASRTYGLNRNVYAMHALGSVFSGSFAAFINCYFLIFLVLGKPTVDQTMWLIALGVGLVFHFLCGLWGGKASLFNEGPMGITEQRREVGRFAPFVRNLLQVATSIAICWLFTEISLVYKLFAAEDMIAALTADIILTAVQAVIIISAMVLIGHATNTTEYSMEGRYASGMKNSKIFTFFVLAASLAAMFLLGEDTFDAYMMVAIVAGAMFLIELIMIKAPRFPDEISGKDDNVTEEEANAQSQSSVMGAYAEGDNVSLDEYFSQYYIKEGVILGNFHHPQYPMYPNYYMSSMPNDLSYMQ